MTIKGWSVLLNEMTAEQILALESRPDLVPATGSVGNVTLLRALSAEGWGEEQYWAIRQRIMDSGALVPGRGRRQREARRTRGASSRDTGRS